MLRLRCGAIGNHPRREGGFLHFSALLLHIGEGGYGEFAGFFAAPPVVGYQTLDVADAAAGGNSWLISTIPALGKALASNTLNDLQVSAPDGGLVSEYSVQLLTYGADGQLEGNFVYLDADSNGSLYGVDSGWYTTASVEDWDPVECGSTTIAFGTGFNILSDCGATITCAGEVKTTSSDILINDSSAGGNTWSGNCTPINLTLADIAITPPEGGLTSEYSVQLLTYGADGQLEGNFVYLDADSNGSLYGVDTGWYTTASVEDWDPVGCGSTEIAAGRMVNILSDCGATMTIPSAL